MKPIQNVGILTMHRVINHGSFMQAYALKSIIESYGYEVSFRDFKAGTAKHKGEKVVLPSLMQKIKKIPRTILNINHAILKRSFSKKMEHQFKNQYWPLLGVGIDHNYDLSADKMFIGSDEVFNYTQNHGFAYVPCLFGHQIVAKDIVSYAASAGYANWTDVVNDDMKEEIGSGFNKINFLSVRDQNTSDIVTNCTGNAPTLVIDPTLLYDFHKEMPKQRLIEGKYLLIYAYGGRMDSPEEISAIKNYAASKKLKIVSAGFYHDWCDENILVSPFELLKVFKDAEFVVTDTFHGSIFAMKNAKQFATFVRKKSVWGSNSNKVVYLLKQFGMESRIVDDLDMIPGVLEAPAPYDIFNKQLEEWQEKSKSFLASVLENRV
ncbi:polysaccharide pyruvyl transferase family protein [Methylobacillus caricis]|uniref:polysaccharide pyruvyl transferase family protein n=1 Tax=Methylobacillus caricis TaxID=1971611 RepID=UPI001CFFCD2D|nr:polysaccharide pyruvyl transferase family protein [Methylobacillus caricis]MCB5188075.1 polysaccharide pyruvyl transferase family protein [Methylobacillus caricis]